MSSLFAHHAAQSLPGPDPQLGHFMPDAACTACRQCGAPFTLTNRRHHCRHCYYIFCGACSRTFMRIPPLLTRSRCASRTADGPSPAHSSPSCPDFALWLLESVVARRRRTTRCSAPALGPPASALVQPANSLKAGALVRPVDSRQAGALVRPAKSSPVPIPGPAWPRTHSSNRNWDVDGTSDEEGEQEQEEEGGAREDRELFGWGNKEWTAVDECAWLQDDLPVFASAPSGQRRGRAPSRSQAKVPRSSMFDTADVRAEERVCDGCKTLVEKVLSSEHTLRALLGNPYLDLHDLATIRGVSKQCATAVDFLHTKWSRFGQAWFDCPDSACDAVVSVMLRQNRHLLHGHPNWEILADLCGQDSAIFSAKNGSAEADASKCADADASKCADADASKCAEAGASKCAGAGAPACASARASCRLLRCRKTCSPAMTAGQCVWVLVRQTHDGKSGGGHLRQRALQRLQDARPPAPSALFELVPFVPTLLWAAARAPDVLSRVILPSLAKSDEFAYLAYFCARHQEPLVAVWTAIRAHLSPAQAAEVTASELLLVTLLGHIGCSDMGKATSSAVTANRPFLPGSAQYRVVTLYSNSIRRIQSSTRPWAVCCSVLDTSTGETQVRTLMVKLEPLWNDLVVGLVQKYLLAVDPSLELEPYYVCPAGPSAGLLLFVSGCLTLHEIEQSGTILKWLCDNSPNKSCAEVQQTFMRSCAATSILSRLMGFGDRHLQNILCTGASGRLVHVDFAYLWSQEPAMSRHRILMPEQTMRITPGMLQVFDARYSADFLALCTRINRTVRSAAVDLHYVCWGLVSAGCVPETVVRAHFNSFMLPYAKNGRDADAAIVSVIQHETETRPRPLVNLFRMLLRYVE